VYSDGRCSWFAEPVDEPAGVLAGRRES
jgi:hypothetical protein